MSIERVGHCRDIGLAFVGIPQLHESGVNLAAYKSIKAALKRRCFVTCCHQITADCNLP